MNAIELAKAIAHIDINDPGVSNTELLHAMIEIARNLEPIKPVVVHATRDQYIEVIHNPDDLPISAKDYEATCGIDVDDTDERAAYQDDYSDSLRQDDDGNWYIERGNV